MKKVLLFLIVLGSLVILACTNARSEEKSKSSMNENTPNTTKTPEKGLSEDFKKYWYAGEAEITSYTLEQARYGEIRSGKAVLIYVTEDFLPEIQVKADRPGPDNLPVLKLNATKNFNTGIYPYSIMQSTFYPVSDHQHAIKVSSSMQEWCGHVFAQINNRSKYEVMSHSYFQGEADQNFTLEKNILENELWTKIRINPKDLPIGDLKMIPSLAFCRMKHKEIKAYNATAELMKNGDLFTYAIVYPKLNRELKISFNTTFPYEIQGWEETFKSGFGPNAKSLTTKATKIKQIKSAYWGKNGNEDEVLREELGLQ